MRRSRTPPPGLLLRGGLLAGAILAAGAARAADGKALYVACAPCHGPHGEGVPATGAPNIAGMAAWYVDRELKAFATGARGRQPGDTFGASMTAAVSGHMADGDRAMLAATVAALPAVRAAAAAPTDNGRNYFNSLCSACHGANGHGNETLGAPRLAGLTPAYLARQIAAFRTGQRGAQAGDRLGAQMRALSAMLPDARTEQDVVNYAAGLAP